MNRKFSFQHLVKELIKKNKKVLVLDTCCILDVIRAIQRNKLSTIESAINIINLYKKEQNDFIIVLPSLILEEWSDNFESVYMESKKYIEKCDENYKLICQAIQLIFEKQINEVCFVSYKVDDFLKNISEKLLDIGLIVDDKDINECASNAGFRVRKGIAPAKKGKDSYKDCMIFEETLYLGKLLRDNGFENKIVFASSNTKEYCLDRKLIETIRIDLEKYNIKIAFSLEHGLKESNTQ
ncbi:PIN domain-containing protein [Lacrimispora sp.]|uniref:PIN domain-containing protein n=1 Tax=Lacrimispora sp. TaxID=2719234 RepID=UPI00399616D7